MTADHQALKKERRQSRFKSCLIFLALLTIILLGCIIFYLLQTEGIINVQFDEQALRERFSRPSPTLDIPIGWQTPTPTPLGEPSPDAPAGAEIVEEKSALAPTPTPDNIGVGNAPPQATETQFPNNAPRHLAVLPVDSCEDLAGYSRPADEQTLGQGWYTMRPYRNLLRAAGLLEAGEEVVENGDTIAIRRADGSFFTLQRGLGLQNGSERWCPKNFGTRATTPIALGATAVSPTPTTVLPTFTATSTPRPTRTATPFPTATALPSATPFPTPTSTPTVTPSPTTTATPRPTVFQTTPTLVPSPPPTLDLRTPTPFALGCPIVLVVAEGVQIGGESYVLEEFTEIFNEATNGQYTVILVDGKLLTAHDQSQLENGEATSPGKVIFTLPEGGIRFLEETYCLQPDL